MPHQEDWHPADIIATLRKRGWSLRRLSLHYGYHPGVLSDAVARPWPKGERLIAEAIGVPPEQIWPSRFAERAARRSRRGQRNPRPSLTA
jgi:Ner family transcriptional regulator